MTTETKRQTGTRKHGEGKSFRDWFHDLQAADGEPTTRAELWAWLVVYFEACNKEWADDWTAFSTGLLEHYDYAHFLLKFHHALPVSPQVDKMVRTGRLLIEVVEWLSTGTAAASSMKAGVFRRPQFRAQVSLEQEICEAMKVSGSEAFWAAVAAQDAA